jgi:hypothetical protein
MALQSISGARNIRTRSNYRTLKPVDQAEKLLLPLPQVPLAARFVRHSEQSTPSIFLFHTNENLLQQQKAGS